MTAVLSALALALALAFGVSGGVHDTANITAPAIASRALTTVGAVGLVAVLGFAGPLLAGTAVADTVGSIVSLGSLSSAEALGAVIAGLVASTLWNVATWRAGLPASSTQALVGGLVGAALAAGGPSLVNWGFAALAEGQLEGVAKVVAALVLSPVAGLALGFLVFRASARILRVAERRWNRRTQRPRPDPGGHSDPVSPPTSVPARLDR